MRIAVPLYTVEYYTSASKPKLRVCHWDQRIQESIATLWPGMFRRAKFAPIPKRRMLSNAHRESL